MTIGTLGLAALVAFRAAPEVWFPQLDRFVGTADPTKSPLGLIGAIVVDRARNVIVSQPDSMRLVVFRPNGTLMTTIGKRGNGAGEYNAIGDFGFVGDTLWVIDDRPQNSRFHLYSRDYRYLTAVPPMRLPLKPKALPATQVALLQNGYVLSRIPPAVTGGSSELVTSTRSGSNVRVLASVKASRSAVPLPTLNTTLMFAELSMLDDFALARVIPGGGGVIVIDRTAAMRPGPASYSVTQYKPDGTVAWKRQLSYTAEAAPAGLVDGPIARAANDIAKDVGGTAKALSMIRAGIGTLPKTIPPVSAVSVGSDGTIWLTGAAIPEPSNWAVLDASGTMIATTTVPEGQLLGAGQRGWGWLVSIRGKQWLLGQYKFAPQK